MLIYRNRKSCVGLLWSREKPNVSRIPQISSRVTRPIRAVFVGRRCGYPATHNRSLCAVRRHSEEDALNAISTAIERDGASAGAGQGGTRRPVRTAAGVKGRQCPHGPRHWPPSPRIPPKKSSHDGPCQYNSTTFPSRMMKPPCTKPHPTE